MTYPVKELFNVDWMRENILNLYHIERKQTFPAWIRAAGYTRDLLSAEGFDAEYLSFPADGKTAWQDKITPIGWNVSDMRLILKTSVPGITNPVLADSKREPAQVVKHSAGTPPEGITARLVTQSRMKAGEDVQGAFVLLDPDARPHKKDLEMLLDLGALGYVSDYVENPLAAPDHASWLNAGTELSNWHCYADERPFIGFMITPRVGFYLRAACANRPVIVHALSDARTYESELPVVTALLKGESEREIWLIAHLYEPLIDDNSSGVVGSIALLKAIRQMAATGQLRLKHSVRVLFMSEMYGTAPYIEHIGEASKKVIGAINMDGLVASSDKCRTCFRAIEGPDYLGYGRTGGFAGNIMLAEATEAYSREHPEVSFISLPVHLSDDCCIGDSTVGIPVVWLYHTRDGLHHNTAQDENLLDVDALSNHLDLCAQWIIRMACSEEPDLKELLPRAVVRANTLLSQAAFSTVRKGEDGNAGLRFLYERELGRLEALRIFGDIPEIDEAKKQVCLPGFQGSVESEPSRWYDLCDHYRFTRLTRGFPHDLAKLPYDRRFRMPGDIIENDLALVVSRLHPGVSLRQVLREVEWETGRHLSDAELRGYLGTLMRLHDAGYLGLDSDAFVGRGALTQVLEEIRIHPDGIVIVEADTDEIRCLPGGAKNVMHALMKTVAAKGALVAPAFAHSWIMANGKVNASADYRPYDVRPDGACRDRTLRDNDLAMAFLSESPVRSGHLSHEWLALGAEAERFAGSALDDEPAGEHSPLMQAKQKGGVLLLIGKGIEDSAVAKLLRSAAKPEECGSAVIRYMDAQGDLKTVLMPNFPREDCIENTVPKADTHTAVFGGVPFTCVNLNSLYDAFLGEEP